MKRFLILMLLMLFQPFQLLAAGFNIDGVPNANINAIDGKPIANVNTMDGVPAAASCATEADSQKTNNNHDYALPIYLTTSFTAGSSYTLCKVQATLTYRSGDTPSGVLTAYIYSDVLGSPGISLGTSTNTVDTATLPTDCVFNFAGISITSTSPYWIVIQHSNAGGNWFLQWYANGSVSGQHLMYSGDAISWTLLDDNFQGDFITYK